MVSCFNGSKGRLKNLSDGLSNDETVSDFDRNGNRSSTELPDGRRLNYLYYGSGHLHHINLEGETVSDLERDGLHREIGRSQGALSSRYELDPLGRLKSQLAVEAKGKGSAGAGFTAVKRRYHYDRNGNLSESSDQRSGTTPFEYDPLGRITRAGGQTFAFDPAHNLLDPTAQQPVSGNRLQRYNGHSYYYDDYGNTVQHETADGSQHNLYYDLYDRLEKAEVFRRNESGGWDKQTWLYQYDALNRRIGKGRLKEDGGLADETRFVWDGSRLLQEVYARGRYTYVYADQDSYEPLAQIHNYTNAGFETYQEINYFHCDQIGIPREMTDKDGKLLWFGNYTGWGRLKEETKVTDSAYQPFRLQNQYADRETGLHYNFFRYYEPDAGRFVNQDPIGLEGGKNFYSYSSNTTKWIDILGLCVKEAEKKLNETMAPHKGKRNAPSIMVAAYTATGLIEVASNGDIPGKIAPELQELADRHGGVGAKTECGNTIGRCAEFRAANKLLLDNPDLKLKDIKFTKAKRPRTGQARPYYDNCVNIFGVTN